MEKEDIKRAVMLKKPSGTIAITGNLSLIQKKFYNKFLFNTQEILKKGIRERQHKIDLKELKKTLSRNKKKLGKDNSYLKDEIYEMLKIFVKYNYFDKDKIIEGRATLLNDIQFDTYVETGDIYVRYNIPAIVEKSMLKRMAGDKDALYANINLKIVKGLTKKHTVTLYELCKDYENVEIPKMTIKDFKEIFGVEGKYKRMTHLRERLLNPACKELNASPGVDFEVSYTLTKRGPKYTHVKFIIKPKEQEKLVNQAGSAKTVEINAIKAATAAAETGVIDQCPELPAKYKTKEVLEILNLNQYIDRGIAYIRAQIRYTVARNPKNFVAYLQGALEKNYAGVEKSGVTKKTTEERIAADKKKRAAAAEAKKKKKKEDAESQKMLKKWAGMTEEKRLQAVQNAAMRNSWVRGKLKKGIWKEDELIPITVMLQATNK